MHAMIDERDLVAAYRRRHPLSRACGIIVYDRNGVVRRRRCIICGERGPTWDSRWPKTRRAEAWEAAHVRSHLENINPVEVVR
jgi:hypothetical protein